jgi:hypothetical protein
VELVPASVRAAWSGAALSRSVELFGKQAWVELYATLGAERFAALPTKLGVLARDQRESVVTCPWTIEADKADVDALLGPRQERSRDGDLRVERRAGGTATWLRTIGGRWELLMAEPAPAACSLIPLDLTGLQRAEVLLALGPPDVQWHGSDGWRLRRAEERQPWYWAVRYRGDGGGDGDEVGSTDALSWVASQGARWRCSMRSPRRESPGRASGAWSDRMASQHSTEYGRPISGHKGGP